RHSIERLARQFIAGESAADAFAPLRRGWEHGSGFTIDLLGEHTLTEEEADLYVARVRDLMVRLKDEVHSWPANPVLEPDPFGSLPRANVSIKPSACTSRYAALTAREAIAGAKARLLPVLEFAANNDTFVWFDMESFDVRDVTQTLFMELLDEPALSA